MVFAWHVGLTVLFLVGIFKMSVAPLGNAVRRLVPARGCSARWRRIALR